jgi:tetratricopeptide (TPR) repeat protein
VLLAAPARAESQKLGDELLLRPSRLTRQGAKDFEKGNHPDALEAFEGASKSRPADPAVKYNLADGLYKNGKFDEAEALYRALGADVRSELAAPSRFNLGNTLYQKKDFKGAIRSYRDALRLQPDDVDARKNLELALRAQRELENKGQGQSRDKKEDEKPETRKPQPGDDKNKDQNQEQKPDASQGPKPQRSPSPEEKADQKFREETGMPRERAMQLLEALQQNEKSEQKKLLAAQRAKKKGAKDW